MRKFKIIPKMFGKKLFYVVRELKYKNVYSFWGRKIGMKPCWNKVRELVDDGGLSEYSFTTETTFKSIKKAKKYIKNFCSEKKCKYEII